jgi:hypothetical protein
MKSRTTRKFWRLFEKLPPQIQNQARETYHRFRQDPAYPSLHFKCVDHTEAAYWVRIGIHYRAVGLLEGDIVTWFWIGSHDDYETLLNS